MESKSLALGLGVILRHIRPEKAQEACRLEEEIQMERWGLVEGGHDMDRVAGKVTHTYIMFRDELCFLSSLFVHCAIYSLLCFLFRTADSTFVGFCFFVLVGWRRWSPKTHQPS